MATQSGPSNCPTPFTIFREALSLEAVPQISGNGTYLFGERCNWRVLRPGPTRRRDLKEAATPKLVDSCLLGLQDSAKETSINSQIPSVAPRIGQLAETGLIRINRELGPQAPCLQQLANNRGGQAQQWHYTTTEVDSTVAAPTA